ncbi:MAG TPA: hypothetical protein VN840_04575 [Streptosporangiaceae bacterium]|nr:hypothetical protein [Streptosporangiaceae bacterium]
MNGESAVVSEQAVLSEPHPAVFPEPDPAVFPEPDPAVLSEREYDAGIRNARRFERIMAAKSLISFALIALVIEIYLYYH